jgi:hypothetical protein
MNATFATNPNPTPMTPDQQRITIATACGYKSYSWRLTSDGWLFADIVPDYLNDLNAMHEAEKVLTADQWYEYDRLMPLHDPQKMHVNAAEKAEAFLRTIGKWEEK